MENLCYKYPPKEPEDLFGINAGLLKLLKQLKTNPYSATSHSFFLTGPSGCGKTSFVKIFIYYALEKRIEFSAIQSDMKNDSLWWANASSIGSNTNEMKNIFKDWNAKPSFLKNGGKFFILEEAELLSQAVAAALKGYISQYPNLTTIIVSNQDFLVKNQRAILSRLLTFRFEPIPKSEVIKKLRFFIDSELKTSSSSANDKQLILENMESVFPLIAEKAQGDMRKAAENCSQWLFLKTKSPSLSNSKIIAYPSEENSKRLLLNQTQFFINEMKAQKSLDEIWDEILPDETNIHTSQYVVPKDLEETVELLGQLDLNQLMTIYIKFIFSEDFLDFLFDINQNEETNQYFIINFDLYKADLLSTDSSSFDGKFIDLLQTIHRNSLFDALNTRFTSIGPI